MEPTKRHVILPELKGLPQRSDYTRKIHEKRYLTEILPPISDFTSAIAAPNLSAIKI